MNIDLEIELLLDDIKEYVNSTLITGYKMC